jgi:hypothetical protein
MKTPAIISFTKSVDEPQNCTRCEKTGLQEPAAWTVDFGVGFGKAFLCSFCTDELAGQAMHGEERIRLRKAIKE